MARILIADDDAASCELFAEVLEREGYQVDQVQTGDEALSRLPETAARLVGESGFGPYAVIISLMLFYILLGAVMDELAMILLTLPVFFPIVQALDFGLPPDEVAIWFGILVLIVVGIGLTAPPIGLNVFVISSIAKTVPIASTYRGVLPFIFTDIIRLGLVLAFPGLALWLVRLLN